MVGKNVRIIAQKLWMFRYEAPLSHFIVFSIIRKWCRILSIKSLSGVTNKFQVYCWFKTCGTSCGTPWKFNSSHLKICHPKRKGSSFNHHFSVAMLNLGGAEHVAFGIAGHASNESDVATQQWCCQLKHPVHIAGLWSMLRDWLENQQVLQFLSWSLHVCIRKIIV